MNPVDLHNHKYNLDQNSLCQPSGTSILELNIMIPLTINVCVQHSPQMGRPLVSLKIKRNQNVI